VFGLGGLWLGFFVAPTDAQQGEGYRIIFVHVPASWMAMFLYCVMAFWAAIGLAFRIRLAAMTASAIAPTGALFALLSLFTGALWGKPMWGAWWVWDARLTSVLVLFFLYLGHIALLNAFDDPARGGRAAAILALAGIVNLPIIKFSVDWWNTLHQPASISRLARPAIDPAILTPLLVMAAAYLAYFVTLLLVRVRAELAAAKLRAARSALLARG
jgi:heme exporter protein C